MSIIKKIGYANASDVSLHPMMSLGDVMFKNMAHISNNTIMYCIQGTSGVEITNSGGDARFRKLTAGSPVTHGKSTGDPVGVKRSGFYNGWYKVNKVDNDYFKLTKLDGTTLSYQGAESTSADGFTGPLWWDMFAGFDEHNFSAGAGSHGKACRQKWLDSGTPLVLTPFDTSYAYQNHNADGSLRAVHGNVDHYTGPIGDKIWLIQEDIVGQLQNDGSGNARVRVVGHGANNRYAMIKITGGAYADRLRENYYFVESVDADHFKLKTNATGSYLPWTGDEQITFSLTWGATKMQGLDVCGTSGNRVTICNGSGQAIFRKDYESVVSYGFEFFGQARFVRITGEYDPVLSIGDSRYQGREGNKKYHSGTYGMSFNWGNLVSNNPMLYLSDGANDIEVDHVEVYGIGGGFAGHMFKTDGYGALGTMRVKSHDNLVHATHGEGVYGAESTAGTPGSPRTKHKLLLQQWNNEMLCSGVEMLQKGQLAEGSFTRNCIFFLSSLDRFDPFFTGQLNTAQVKGAIGGVDIEGNLFFGGGLQCKLMQSDRADEVADAAKVIRWKRNLFSDSCGYLFYFGMSGNDGVTPVELEDIYYRNVWPYDSDKNATDQAYSGCIRSLDAVSPIRMNNVIIDSGNALPLVEGAVTNFNTAKLVRNTVPPEPLFVASGFSGMNLRNVTNWIPTYDVAHHQYPGQNVVYAAGRYVFDRGRLYKVISTVSGTTRPELDPTHYQLITWDVNGVRSDQVGFTSPYSYTAPMDFRLVADDFYNLQFMGLIDNMPNTLTRFSWEYCHDNGGSPNTSFIRKLPLPATKEQSATEIKNRIGAGKWVRVRTTPVDAVVGASKQESFIQIN